jgi:hypothetical protein
MSSDPDIIALACRHFNVDCTGSSEQNLDSIINPVRDSLIERIMGEFWTVFNQEWSANIRRRTESPHPLRRSRVQNHNNQPRIQTKSTNAQQTVTKIFFQMTITKMKDRSAQGDQPLYLKMLMNASISFHVHIANTDRGNTITYIEGGVRVP